MNSKENNQLKKTDKKKTLGLICKILGVAMIPLLITIIIASLDIQNIATRVSTKLSKHELNTAVYSIENLLDYMGTGDFSYSDGDLYKGSTNITANSQLLDKFSDNTELDATIIVGRKRILSSIKDKSGNRVQNTEIDNKIYDKVLKTGEYFVTQVNIEGESYEGYYKLIDDSTSGQEVIVFAGIKSEVAKSAYIVRMRSSIILLIVIALIAAICVSAVLLGIVKAIEIAVHNLDKVAEGELNFAVSEKILKRNDEIGTIAQAIHSLIQNIASTITNILHSATELDEFSGKFKDNFTSINNSISNVNIAIEEIANGATNQANETQNVNTQITDMGNAIDATTANIDTLNSSTETMKDHNRQVNNTLDELIKISDRTKESIDEVHKQTNITNQSASEIGEAVNIITDIASQTNLLSLNASIEAARAGEYGRGFAVVADEIRQLADQSSESAEKISQIVAELVRNSNTSVDTMDTVLTDITDQFDKLNTTRKVFDKLNAEIKNVANAVESITDQVDSINTVKNEVLGSVESLAAIAQENAASTEETSAAMFELGQIVNDCNESTQQLVTLSNEMTDNANKFKL